MNKQLEDIYVDMITAQPEEVLEEGMFDRLGARAKGAVGGLKGVGKSLAGSAIQGLGKLAGSDTAQQAGQDIRQQSGIKAGYNAAKAKSIAASFQNDMKSLFGDAWVTTYPDLAKV